MLASEIYGIIAGVDIIFVISFTLKIITEQLGLLVIPIIVYTDLYSLYEYLIKFSITKEKRLIIDIIAIR
jgi:hypothetical protein